MQQLTEYLTERRNTLIFSILLHLLFALVAVFIQVGIDFNPAEFAEISFISGTQGAQPMPQIKTETVVPAQPRRQETIAAPKPVVRETAPLKRQGQQAKTDPVAPPKRRMLDREEPQMATRNQGKLTPEVMDNTAPPQEETLTGRPIDTARNDLPSGDRPAQSVGTSGQQSTRTIGPVSPLSGDQPFTIEGDAAQRSIMSQIIPQYPAGLQSEAVVKIRFTVLPDGRIGSMIPMRKGDPTLEEITFKALRQWRFNPLPANAEQRNVTGIITFRYELQ